MMRPFQNGKAAQQLVAGKHAGAHASNHAFQANAISERMILLRAGKLA